MSKMKFLENNLYTHYGACPFADTSVRFLTKAVHLTALAMNLVLMQSMEEMSTLY